MHRSFHLRKNVSLVHMEGRGGVSSSEELTTRKSTSVCWTHPYVKFTELLELRWVTGASVLASGADQTPL